MTLLNFNFRKKVDMGVDFDYFNTLIDDKAGFDLHNDWAALKEYFEIA